eukprot:2709185-Pleurochrysis_carterae.AAC.1
MSVAKQSGSWCKVQIKAPTLIQRGKSFKYQCMACVKYHKAWVLHKNTAAILHPIAHSERCLLPSLRSHKYIPDALSKRHAARFKPALAHC